MEPTVVVAVCGAVAVAAVSLAIVAWVNSSSLRDIAEHAAEVRVTAERNASRLESENASLTRHNRELMQMLQNVRDAISEDDE